jgi:hypothetical protein
MKRIESPNIQNAIIIVVTAISILTVFGPFEILAQSGQPDPTSYGLTPGRLAANIAVLLGLVGTVFGVLALIRPNGRFGTATGWLGAVIALAAGLTGIIISLVVAASSGGRVGTGGGLAGAIIALVLGLVASALGGLALSRSRR